MRTVTKLIRSILWLCSKRKQNLTLELSYSSIKNIKRNWFPLESVTSKKSPCVLGVLEAVRSTDQTFYTNRFAISPSTAAHWPFLLKICGDHVCCSTESQSFPKRKSKDNLIYSSHLTLVRNSFTDFLSIHGGGRCKQSPLHSSKNVLLLQHMLFGTN